MKEKSDYPKISVIVPVYNVENYLSRCLDSILNQTYSDFEVLLVDDGSRDNSGCICDEYALKDSRIQVYHKENGGVSSARNVGIQNARGKYSIHVDGDDSVEPEMLERLWRTAELEKADVVIVDFFIDTGHKVRLKTQRPESLEPDKVIEGILTGKLHGSTWNKLIKHEMYFKYHITFPENINCCEDVLVVTRLLLQQLKVVYLPEAFYHYTYNPNSIIRTLTRKTFDELFLFVEKMQKILEGNAELTESLNYTKLIIRKDALFSKCYTSKEYKEIYPEADRLLSKASFNVPVKILLSMASKGCYSLVGIVVSGRNFIKHFYINGIK